MLDCLDGNLLEDNLKLILLVVMIVLVAGLMILAFLLCGYFHQVLLIA